MKFSMANYDLSLTASLLLQAFLDRQRAEKQKEAEEEERKRKELLAQQQQQQKQKKFRIPKAGAGDTKPGGGDANSGAK